MTFSNISARISKYSLYTFLLALAIFIGSCEKVIDIDLNEADKKYVIEGYITDVAGTAKVLISQTKNFDESNDFAAISGAVVSIREEGGTPVIFNETQPGIYENAAMRGSSGKQYTLSVTMGGKTFTGYSTMPVKVNLDSIYVTDEFIFTETKKIVNAVLQDPPGIGNNYRFVQYVNNKKEDQIMLRNDDYSDARKIVNKLFYFDDDDSTRTIKRGDNIRIDMHCIDPVIFKYWYSLDRSSTGGSEQATPSNPVSNLQGGALGYFSAHTSQTKTMIVP
jgi:hypothetical protein